MNWEITTFIAYFVILLGVALVFYFNGTNKKFGGLLPRRTLHGPLGHRLVRAGVRYVRVAADGPARLDPRLRLRPDVDRHRPCHRYGGQLDPVRQATAHLLQGGERFHHAPAVPDEPLRGRFPRCSSCARSSSSLPTRSMWPPRWWRAPPCLPRSSRIFPRRSPCSPSCSSSWPTPSSEASPPCADGFLPGPSDDGGADAGAYRRLFRPQRAA